ncbi:MAG: TIR domain-containing protein [Chloroflexi bacterium]|nr:MAG: TIR domain-containing protein [Chloroflexota bacterium]
MAKKATFAYDVFISYSHQNKNWVRNVLLPRLERANLRVFIDFRDFRVGAASVKEMERGVATSRKILVALTPEYLESGWAEFERLMIQTLDPANQGLRIIPVLRKKCSLPPSIGYMTYVNLSNSRNKESEWQRLIDAIGQSAAIPQILVVDDESDVLKTIAGYLEDAGYEVYAADNESVALRILKRKQISFAIIDIKLHESPEDESGLKLADAIYALAPQIKIIILSGSQVAERIIRAFKDLGVVDYIIKTPDMGEKILKTIQEQSAMPGAD